MIRTIIIDDEPSAINVLRLLLRKKFKDEIEIIATAGSALEGKQLIENHRPDLVLLDIEMPGMSGIDLVHSCAHADFHLVFTTAYDAYAVQAFELSALDYLLKPVSAEKIVRVIEKIKNDIHTNQDQLSMRLENLERLLRSNSNGSEKISLGTPDKILFINVTDIVYCEARGAYTNIHLNDGKSMLTSKTLGDFESQLLKKKFFRIHHSFLINLNRVKEFQRHKGTYVLMENNIKLDVSQRKRKELLEAIGQLLV